MAENTPLLADEAVRCTADFDDSCSKVSCTSKRLSDDPLEWSTSFKWFIVALLSFAAFMTTFGCISVAPIANRIVDNLDGGNESQSSAVLLVTIWEVGEAAGPLLIGPLSELFGRWPIFNLANICFILAMVLGAMSVDSSMFIASRMLTGMAVAANVLNPAIVGDIFVSEQRGTAMSCIMLAPLFASSLGPACSGLITEHWGWRVVVWVAVCAAVLCELAFLFCFRETYVPSILKRREKKLRNVSYGSDGEPLAQGCNSEKPSTSLLVNILRPFVVFFGSGVLTALSLFGAVIFSYFYVVATTLPNILEDKYDFSPANTGIAFLANGVGTLIGVIICKSSLDRIYIKLSAANGGIGRPEYRLPLPIIGVFTLPPAVVLYGLCAHLTLPLPLFMFATLWVRVSMTLAFLPLMSYVVDACGMYSASALTGVIVTRCLAGAFFPLATAAMIEMLGYGWGFCALGLLTIVVGIIPVLIMRYGAQWRQGSPYTRDETD